MSEVQGESQKLKVIGLTGGIGAGKSTVAALFREAGMPVLDMDRIGREVLDSPPGIAIVRSLFGDSVLTDGKVDRRKVRDVVFADRTRREALERELHPVIRARFDADAAELRRNGARAVICEAALLIETGRHASMDALVVVLAEESLRLSRVVSRDSIPITLAREMSAAQVTDEIRREVATTILHNDGSLEHLEAQVNALVEEWRGRGWLGNMQTP